MPPIKIVIVDDSAFVRKVVREMLSKTPNLDVVGMARHGEDALQMVEELQPDVVTCDLNMPEMDGVEFVRRQMARKKIPILILTASPQDGGKVLEALEAGAVDFLQKPTAFANDELLTIQQDLLEKIFAAAQMPKPALDLPKLPLEPVAVSSPAAKKVDIVVLGISTGGPQALRYLIPQLPADFPVPMVIVLHMPVGYTALYAEKLAEISAIPFKEAFEGCAVRPGEVLLAPAGRHLSFKRTSDGVMVQLSIHPTNKLHRPSVDVLFKAAAETYNERVLGVVMTGMGDDGKEGAAWIKAKGGTVLTESEESCVIYGMPRSVVEAGLSDATFSLSNMAEGISKRL